MIKCFRETPNGNRTIIFQERVENLAPAGGASEGAGSAVSTPEKRMMVNSPIELVNDDKLVITVTPDAGATMDATDCVWMVPLQTQAGSKTIGRAQFQDLVPADFVLIASEQDVGRYKVTEGRVVVRGKIYLDIQNNA